MTGILRIVLPIYTAAKAAVLVLLLIVVFPCGGRVSGEEGNDTIVLDDLRGEDRFIVAVTILSAEPNAETKNVWFGRHPNGIGLERPQRISLAPNPRENVQNAVRLLEVYLAEENAEPVLKHRERAQRYLQQAKAGLSQEDISALLASLPYRQLTYLRSDTFSRREPWYMSLQELQRLLPGWQPEHQREIDYGAIYAEIEYSPGRRPEEQVRILWTSSLAPDGKSQGPTNFSAVYLDTIRSELDRACAEHPQRSETATVGLVCGGITLVMYLLPLLLAWKFLVPRWRAGRSPIPWHLTEAGKGYAARAAVALAGLERKRKLRAMFADDEDRKQLTNGGIDPNSKLIQSLIADVPEVGVCYFCERAPADPQSAYYAEKLGLKKPGRKEHIGFKTWRTTYTQEVRSMTFPRCQQR